MQTKIITQVENTTADGLLDMFLEKIRNSQPQPVQIDEAKPLSIEEASQFLGLAKQTIYKFTSEGTIKFHKQGGKLFFFRSELIAWIKNESPTTSKVHLR